MRWNLGKAALLTAILGWSAAGQAWAQPATPAAKSASEQAQAAARARDLAAAGNLLGRNQFVAAIAAYQKMLADDLDAESKMAAELGLARALGRQDPAKGVERLQAFLERYDNADPKIVTEARTALGDAREAQANSYLAARQFDKAIVALSQIASDKHSEEARVGKAWDAIAKVHVQLGEPKKAIEAYQQLLRRPGTDSAARFAQVRNLLALDPTALGALEKFVAENAGAKREMLAEAYLMLGGGYEGAGENKKALQAFQRAASMRGTATDPVTAEHTAAARVGTARAYHRLGETKKAVNVYRGLLSDPGLEPARRFAYVKALQQIDPSANIAAEVAVHLNGIRSWKEFYPGALAAAELPSSDVALFATKSRQEAIDAHKWELRRRTGRATPAQLQAFAKTIDSPGVKESFVVSPESKALAAAVSEKAPLGAYFKALLAGDHAGAAKIAWRLAHTPGMEAEYADWLEAVARAVQCHDQAYGKRAADFITWSNGALTQLPQPLT